jgi:hypothetical protein
MVDSSLGVALQTEETVPSQAVMFGDSRGWLQQVSEFVTALILLEQWKFMLGEDDLDASEVSDPQGLLGAVLWKAEKSVRALLGDDINVAVPGASLGVAFVPDSDSVTLGATPVLLPSLCSARGLPLVFCLDVLKDVEANHQVHRGEYSIDFLVEEFIQDKNNGLIPWVQNNAPRPVELAQAKV